MASQTLKLSGGLKLGQLTSAPADPAAGLIYYNSTSSEFQFYNGSGFVEIADFGQLGSTATGLGASLIGIEDAAANFTATNVEAALAELYDALGDAGATTFDEAEFRIFKTGAPTTELIFSLTALSEDRTITMPDANVNLGLVGTAIQRDGSVAFTANQPMGGFKLTGLGAGSGAGDSVRYEQAILVNGANAFTADQSMGGFKLTNLADPTSAQDAATRAYVLTQIGNYINGVKPKQSVRVAADVDIDIATELENGAVVDGITLATGNRVLLTAQANAAENGIYVVPASGAASRSADFDSLTPIDEINGSYVPVQEGSYAGATFVQYGTVATLGTDDINFTYIPAIVSIVGGDMITVTGSTISVDLATVSGLESSNPGNDAGQLRIKLEASNPSLQIDGSNQLGAKLYSGGALVKNSSGLLVNTDGTTLEIATNALQIKDLGVSTAKIADNAVTNEKLRDSAALSVIGRSTNSSGDPADIAASNDNEVLRRSGTSLGFGLLVNANIDAAAAIAYSKLDLTDSIVNADINSAAGIVYSKLSLTNSIVNADINASAAIVGTKISPDFGSQNIRTTGSIFQGAANDDVEEQWIYNATLTGGASNTALSNLTFDAGDFGGLFVVYQIRDTSNQRRRTGYLLVSANNQEGTDADEVDITDVSNETGDVGVTWSVAINTGNVEVRYTTTANDKTFNAKVFKMRKS